MISFNEVLEQAIVIYGKKKILTVVLGVGDWKEWELNGKERKGTFRGDNNFLYFL